MVLAVKKSFIEVKDRLIVLLVPRELHPRDSSSFFLCRRSVIVHLFIAIITVRQHLFDCVGSCDVTLELPLLFFLNG